MHEGDERRRHAHRRGALDHQLMIGAQYQDVTTKNDAGSAFALGLDLATGLPDGNLGDRYWINLFDPAALARLLAMPDGARPVAILCLGHVPEFYPKPMLEEQAWAERADLSNLLGENRWPEDNAGRT